jgi:hypothetical protein
VNYEAFNYTKIGLIPKGSAIPKHWLDGVNNIHHSIPSTGYSVTGWLKRAPLISTREGCLYLEQEMVYGDWSTEIYGIPYCPHRNDPISYSVLNNEKMHGSFPGLNGGR